MANTDKNIIITPNNGAITNNPTMVFTGANTTALSSITLTALPDNSGTLTFSGASGNIMSITNNSTRFSIFDGLLNPSIQVSNTGNIILSQYAGNVSIGNVSSTTSYGKFTVHPATNLNFSIAQGTTNTSAIAISSLNDAASANMGLEFRYGNTQPASFINNGTEVIRFDSLGNILIYNNKQSISTTTGALQVTGGVGVTGNINAGNVIATYIVGDGSLLTGLPIIYGNTINGSSNLAINTLTTVGNITVGQYIFPLNSTNAYASPIVLNDISNQCNGATTVFNLMQDQTNINTLVDSKDLEVVVNGIRLAPYVKKDASPWLTPYGSFNGFRVITIPDPNDLTALTTLGQVIIYKAPYIGASVLLIATPLSSARQIQKYPFTATTIALGD